MKNVSNGRMIEFRGKKIVETLSANNSLTKERCSWSLDHLEVIVTSDTLEDDKKRREIAYKKRRNSNILTGAVLGGFMDGSNGDDTIVDGVLIGAAFGGLMTSGPGEPKAKVGLIFSDNESLTVEVNSSEYSELQTIAKRNLRRESFPEGPSLRRELPSKKEAQSILQDRGFGRMKASLAMAMCTVIALSVGASFLSSMSDSASSEQSTVASEFLGVSSISQEPEQKQSLTEAFGAPSSSSQKEVQSQSSSSFANQSMTQGISEMGQFVPFLGVLIAGIVLVGGVMSATNPRSQVREDEEERYDSMLSEESGNPEKRHG